MSIFFSLLTCAVWRGQCYVWGLAIGSIVPELEANSTFYSEGHESINQLKEAYHEKIDAVRAQEAIPGVKIDPFHAQSSAPSATSTSASTSPISSQLNKQATTSKRTTSVPGIKPLSSYIDVDKVKSLPAKEVEALWRLRHANDAKSICAAIPLATYNRVIKTARTNPQFLLPLPREVEVPVSMDESKKIEAGEAGETTKTTAAEMHFLQWSFHPPATTEEVPANSANTHTSTAIFTHLAQYKLHGAYAQPHTIITHHLDLVDGCGLVLMNGTVLPDRGVTVDEATLLAMWLQKFYDWGDDGLGGGRKAEILKMFTAGDAEGFKIEELVDEVERV